MLSRLFAKINVPKAAWVMIAVGTALRIFQMVDNPLQVDEAESSINGLTILQHGVPIESYLGEPIFENTLTDPWPENEEYEFKDSSYSPKGLAVYHAWLPLYSIAAAEWIFGIEPDAVQENPQILHGADSVLKRTVVPRLPSILFSVGFMLASFMAARKLAGSAAGWAALTWTSIGTRAISNGHQARYYSLTLLMNAVFAIVYFRACRRGRMRDFCILGVAEGLLFHTHQLSAVVAAAVAACGLKQISRHPNWLQKCTVSGLIALTIILPWALLSGFFDTASSVPKAYVLFHGWQDWFRYLATQVTEIVLALGGLIAIILLKYNKTDKPLENASSLKSQSILLMSWCVCAFLAFHIFIPAASFFTERLTLMLITPYVLLVSAAIGILCQRFIPRFQVPASVLCMFTILFISNSHPKLVYKNALDKFALIIDTLDKKEFNPGTKFYAAPNYHLVWTYYTGVPVQSIAPIRKEFLDSYPAPIVYIESRPFHLQVHELSVQDYLRRNKISMTEEEMAAIPERLWRRQIYEDLTREGLQPEYVPEIEGKLLPLSNWNRKISNGYADLHLKEFSTHPMFQGLEIRNPSELWFTFFFRFVNPSERVGPNANYRDRLIGSSITPVPYRTTLIYESLPKTEISTISSQYSNAN